MSDSTPLVSAHSHARNAASEFSKSNRKESSTQHQLAANDFSRAARNTSDSEALRILRHLEDQHAKIAQILQKSETVPAEVVIPDKTATAPVATLDSATKPSTIDTKTSQDVKASAKATSPSTTRKASNRLGSQIRESSPSLAREIATRRGIPPTGKGPATAVASARSRQLSPEARRSRHADQAGLPAKIPPSIVDSQASLKETRKTKKAEDDEGFAKFYNSLTTGTMSKLSSALAYAGLPLTADDIRVDSTTQKRTVSANNEPDVKRYISKAALDAVESQHRKRGTFGHGFGPAESFYVVQTGGGTYSYADITKNFQAPLSTMEEDDEEAFVDAKEVPGPSSPTRSRLSTQRRGGTGKGIKTSEELELENTTLRSTVDFLSSRLSHFEAHAQDAAMASMTQSMMSPRNTQEPGDVSMQQRLRALEQQVARQAEERQQLEDRAAKQARVLDKYESKWKAIKTSAQAKDKAKRAEREGVEGPDQAVSVQEPA